MANGRYEPAAPGADLSGPWARYATTRPFKRCVDCADALISSAASDKCPRCELAAREGPKIGPSYQPTSPTTPSGPDNVKRDRPGKQDVSATNEGI